MLLLSYAAVLAVAAGATYVLAFGVRRVAVRLGAVVLPDDRKVHASATPTAGGAAMFLGFLVAMGVASQLPRFKPVFEGSSEPLGLVLAAGAIFVVGLVDDLREVSAPAKLAGQVLAGTVLYFLGVTMFFFRVPFGDLLSLSADLQPLVTVLWVVAIANAVNLIDGLDGLAAGIIAIAAAAFFFYSNRLFDAGLLAPENVGPLAAVVVCGICLGFLPHNIHPARMFMGDAGALMLGLLMASSTIVVGGQIDDQFSGQTYFFFAPMVIPFFILGVPILDTLFAILRRTVRRAAISTPDKEHLHHRLMRLGHGHRRAVVILWGWTAILSALVLFPPFTGEGNALVPFLVVGLGAGLYTLFHPGMRHRAEAASEDRFPEEPWPSPITFEPRPATPVQDEDEDEGLASVVRLPDHRRRRSGS